MKNIKIYREKNCLTQRQLAKKVGVSNQYISYIENEHKMPSFKTLNKIAKALGVRVSELLEETSNEAI